ncbi:MAG: hypothetical protein HYY30_04635 [Chloroflexi bacterium]|nr:hypothetical protein [Chloroflexota bacterium]
MKVRFCVHYLLLLVLLLAALSQYDVVLRFTALNLANLRLGKAIASVRASDDVAGDRREEDEVSDELLQSAEPLFVLASRDGSGGYASAARGLGMVQALKGDGEAAVKTLREAVASNTDDPLLPTTLVRSVEVGCSQGTEVPGLGDCALLERLVWSLRSAGREDEIVDLAVELTDEPEGASFARRLGLAFLARMGYPDAELADALIASPVPARTRFVYSVALGDLYRRKHERDRAVGWYRRAAWLQSQRPDELAARDADGDAGRVPVAVNVDRFVNAGPTRPWARPYSYGERGSYYLNSGQPEHAAYEFAFDGLSRGWPPSEWPQYHFSMAGLYKTIGRQDCAALELKKILRREPGRQEAVDRLADIERQGLFWDSGGDQVCPFSEIED